MSEILITQEPSAPIEIDAIAGRVLTVTSPPEVYLPYIGANGHWWVGGIDSDIPARGEPGEKGSDGLINIKACRPLFYCASGTAYRRPHAPRRWR